MRHEILNRSNFNCKQPDFPNLNPNVPPGMTIGLYHANLPLKLDILSPCPPGGEIESGREECPVFMGYQYQEFYCIANFSKSKSQKLGNCCNATVTDLHIFCCVSLPLVAPPLLIMASQAEVNSA